MPNNGCWSAGFIAACYQQGVRHFAIAPGSRSAPLALAAFYASKHFSDVQLHTHFDERGLGFFAFNLARGSASPVVVITTSGTAVANVYPAVIEAYETAVQLWIVSADRPDHLLGCGANQAIQQKHIFGKNVLRSENLTIADNPSLLLTSVANLNGPIHFNCQFNEPLYEAIESDFREVFESLKYFPTHNQRLNRGVEPPAEMLTKLEETVRTSARPIIVLGSLTPRQAKVLEPWLRQLNCPIIADITSQFRFAQLDNLLSHADLYLQSKNLKSQLQTDCVLQFGGRMVSKRINQWLENCEKNYWLLSEHTQALDPSGKAVQLQVDFKPLLQRLEPNIFQHKQLEALRHSNQAVSAAVSQQVHTQWSEAGIAWQLLESTLDRCALFAANSLSIRMLDSYSTGKQAKLDVFANRGASGIDGLIASAAALAKVSEQDELKPRYKQVVLVIGDTAFLHDLNSLALAANQECPVKILLLNNNGGHIFGLLPAANEQGFSELFVMPHNQTFSAAARQFGLGYVRADSLESFQPALENWLSSPQSAVLECVVNNGTEAIAKNLNALALLNTSSIVE